MIVTARNPTVLEVRRIKSTHVVVILFDGMRVSNSVACGTALVPCFLYKRQVDVCYDCGHVGHRADVCPSNEEEKAKCRGCGKPKSMDIGELDDHQCTPKCEICGGPHLTGDRTCKHRYQIPYIVRRRRRRRRQKVRKEQMAEKYDICGLSTSDTPNMSPTPVASGGSILKTRSHSRGRYHSRGRSRSRRSGSSRQGDNYDASQSRSRSRSRSQSAQGTSWADKVKGTARSSSKGTESKKTTGEVQPEHMVDPRIQSLEAENRQLRRELAELKEALNSIRGKISSRDEEKSKHLTPLAGKLKRKAPNPEPISESEEEDEMTEASETPSTASAPPTEKKSKSKLTGIERTLNRMQEQMMEMFSSLESRLSLLERPKAHSKSRPMIQSEPPPANPNSHGGAKGLNDFTQ
ncbi:hypothetical protein MTO96_033126 [Rhipicephalus appendiculatus]